MWQGLNAAGKTAIVGNQLVTDLMRLPAPTLKWISLEIIEKIVFLPQINN